MHAPCREAHSGTSVVLITRNQAWNVEAAVTSAISELEQSGGGEVIVVDSDSSDGTLERAAGYAVGLVELGCADVLTPSLGRWLGSRLARCEEVLFLDGDMSLARGWLPEARAVLASMPEVGCVCGTLIYGDDVKRESPPHSERTDVRWFNGAALIRRDVLECAGTFNPVLRSEEESELSTRIRAAGYRIIRLERPIATHPANTCSPLRDVFARRRRGLYLGFGQVLKLHARAPSRAEYCQRRAFWLLPALGLAGLGGSVARARRAHTSAPIGHAATLAMLLFALQVKRKGGFSPAAAGVTSRAAILEGTVRGVRLRATPPRDFDPPFLVHREPPYIPRRS